MRLLIEHALSFLPLEVSLIKLELRLPQSGATQATGEGDAIVPVKLLLFLHATLAEAWRFFCCCPGRKRGRVTRPFLCSPPDSVCGDPPRKRL